MERAVNVAQYRVQQPAVALSSTEHLETSFGIKQRLAVSFPSVCNKQINHLPEDEEIGRLPTAHTESSWPMGLTDRPHRVFVADGAYRPPTQSLRGRWGLPSRPHRVFVADGAYRAARNDSPLCWRIW
jgi:hypothetical protein